MDRHVIGNENSVFDDLLGTNPIDFSPSHKNVIDSLTPGSTFWKECRVSHVGLSAPVLGREISIFESGG